jgi:hypothetical protein
MMVLTRTLWVKLLDPELHLFIGFTVSKFNP